MTIDRGCWALCFAGLMACGGGGITLDALAPQEAVAVCSLEQRCAGIGYPVLIGDTTCSEAAAQGLDNGGLAALRAAVAAGTVVYHADLVQPCLDAIQSATCADANRVDLLPACEAAITGTIMPGGVCSISPECMGDAYCKRPAATMPGGTTCPGTCTARVGAGQHCTGTDDCALGLYCDRTSTCAPPAIEGQGCGGAAGQDCATGLDCVGDTPTVSGTCHDLSRELSAASGAPCDLANAVYCVSGLSCALDAISLTSQTGTCVMPVLAGAACKVALPEMCPSGQYCLQAVATAPDGTCTPLPGIGAPCRATLFALEDRCLGDAVCVTEGTASTCRAKVANAGACTSDTECWSGRCAASACAAPEMCM